MKLKNIIKAGIATAVLLNPTMADGASKTTVDPYMGKLTPQDSALIKTINSKISPKSFRINVGELTHVICAQQGCTYNEMKLHEAKGKCGYECAVDKLNGSMQQHGRNPIFLTPEQQQYKEMRDREKLEALKILFTPGKEVKE